MASTNTPMAKPLPTIFFIPGAWHTPWIFDNVRSMLSARGFPTDSCALATVGNLDASTGMLADAAKMRAALLAHIEAGKEIVLVAHSYGGVVASNAVEGLGVHQRTSEEGGIVMILYLSSIVLPVNVRISASGLPSSDDWVFSEDTLFISPRAPLNLFYSDVKPALAVEAVASLKPMPAQILNDRSTYDPRNRGFELGYIFTKKDRALSIETQKAMYSSFPEGSFSASLNSCHSPFLNMPDSLADVIENAVEFLLKKRSSPEQRAISR